MEVGPHLLVLVTLVPSLVGLFAKLDIDIVHYAPESGLVGCLAILVGAQSIVLTALYATLPEWFAFLQLAPYWPPAVVAGAIIALAGAAFASWARIILAENWTGGPFLHVRHTLTARGPYRWVRHPMYVGFAVTSLGLLIGTLNLAPFLSQGLFSLILLRQTVTEEKLLESRFGDEFYRYRQRTGRFWPRFRTQKGV